MSLFDKLFKPQQVQQQQQVSGYFKTLNAYTPIFTSYSGGMYEMELTRAAVHAFATHCSKLKPTIQGSAYKNLERTLQFRPNPFMSTSQFLYRIATILAVDTTAFIVPITGPDGLSITGFYPILSSMCEILDVQGEPFLRYTFFSGQKACIELSRVGVLTQFQYKDDFFGSGNNALMPTLNLLDIQRQGSENAIKQSAVLRFMAKLAQTMRPEDIVKERDRFSADNLSADNTSGVMLIDQKYSEIKQIDSKPYLVDSEQMKLIQENVYSYFGVNKDILQNSFDENSWNAFYQGKIEPFALQLSLVMTNMMFSQKEEAFGNSITFTANRFEYLSNNTKTTMTTQLLDRGVLSRNEARAIFNLEPIPNGDNYIIRKEYGEAGAVINEGSDMNALQRQSTVQNPGDPAATTGTTGARE